ncbi:hypothetical protein BDK51DRAFT_49597 [Blyttiomyces helicus]|uniref:Uncharacterized protein n=1 Tax=Blyttiomyces helicus TaxID=388810 RepID=A0A4P9W1D0_9FUNG|nr:hypothetical protein BDK51DRAFT_49597 [Blyttiomyces helicus]|eukprot:RKO83876.1 hypothetical protein BDK51DRAFT_49597 [Blyttiomyces helicus]
MFVQTQLTISVVFAPGPVLPTSACTGPTTVASERAPIVKEDLPHGPTPAGAARSKEKQMEAESDGLLRRYTYLPTPASPNCAVTLLHGNMPPKSYGAPAHRPIRQRYRAAEAKKSPGKKLKTHYGAKKVKLCVKGDDIIPAFQERAHRGSCAAFLYFGAPLILLILKSISILKNSTERYDETKVSDYPGLAETLDPYKQSRGSQRPLPSRDYLPQITERWADEIIANYVSAVTALLDKHTEAFLRILLRPVVTADAAVGAVTFMSEQEQTIVHRMMGMLRDRETADAVDDATFAPLLLRLLFALGGLHASQVCHVARAAVELFTIPDVAFSKFIRPTQNNIDRMGRKRGIPGAADFLLPLLPSPSVSPSVAPHCSRRPPSRSQRAASLFLSRSVAVALPHSLFALVTLPLILPPCLPLPPFLLPRTTPHSRVLPGSHSPSPPLSLPLMFRSTLAPPRPPSYSLRRVFCGPSLFAFEFLL